MRDFSRFSEFSVGSVIGNAARVMRRKPLAFFGITLLASILSTIIRVALAPIWVTLFPWFISLFNIPAAAYILIAATGEFAVGIISIALGSSVFQGALTYAIFMLLQQGGVSMVEAFQRSTSRVPTIILASLIMSFAMGLIFNILFLLGIHLAISVRRALGTLIFIVAIIASVVLTSLLFVKWSAFAPACMVERTGAIASLWISSDLTKDYRCKIFGMFILVGIILVIFFAIAKFCSNNLIFGTGLLGYFFSVIVLTFPLTFLNVLPAVIYFRLRTVKENFTLESLADIFD